MIERVGGSFRDPTSRVYTVAENGTGVRILRGLDAETKRNFENLVAEPFYNRLLNENRVVESRLLDVDNDATARRLVTEGRWEGVLEHKAIPFVSYPYEWTFGMLKMAALLHLKILSDALENGWILKDSTPFNIQFVGCQPVFIDIPSFVPWEDGESWYAYRQFCSCFLTPLLMKAHLDIDHLPIMRAYLDGIPPTEAVRYFRGLSRFKKGVMSHIFFPAYIENKILRKERDNVPVQKRGAKSQSRSMVIGLVDGLARMIRSLSIASAHTDWSNYDQTHTYDDIEHASKKAFVQEAVEDRDVRVLWDIGCNTGTFSKIAAPFCEHVVAIDGDHNAIEKLFQTERKHSTNVLPLVLNLANISPNQGWAGEERKAFDQRGKPDVILVLALIHHIRISSNIPIELFLLWLRKLDSDIVIEFVNREDEMVIKLLTNKKEKYHDYNIDNFIKQLDGLFNIKKRKLLKGGKREIFHLSPA